MFPGSDLSYHQLRDEAGIIWALVQSEGEGGGFTEAVLSGEGLPKVGLGEKKSTGEVALHGSTIDK